jgi:hypothetical protein
MDVLTRVGVALADHSRRYELADRRLGRALRDLLAMVPAVDPSSCPNSVDDGCC